MNSIRNLKCRNCECWHQTEWNAVMFTPEKVIYDIGHPTNVCEDVACRYLLKFALKGLACCKYEPTGNLEFLEYKYDQIKPIKSHF